MPDPSLISLGPLDLRIGTIRTACEHPDARRPSLILEIDLGPLGIRVSSARITDLYAPETLPGRQVVCVANLPPRRIGSVISEVLILGTPDRQGRICLLQPDTAATPIPDGAPVH